MMRQRVHLIVLSVFHIVAAVVGLVESVGVLHSFLSASSFDPDFHLTGFGRPALNVRFGSDAGFSSHPRTGHSTAWLQAVAPKVGNGWKVAVSSWEIVELPFCRFNFLDAAFTTFKSGGCSPGAPRPAQELYSLKLDSNRVVEQSSQILRG